MLRAIFEPLECVGYTVPSLRQKRGFKIPYLDTVRYMYSSVSQLNPFVLCEGLALQYEKAAGT